MFNTTKSLVQSIIAILLLSVMIFSLVGCNTVGEGNESTDPPATDESTAESAVTTEPETEQPKPKEDRLIFYEDFESYDLESDSAKIIKMLGWEIDSKENNAYTNNTTKYSLVEKNGSKVLNLENNIKNGGDSYVIVIDNDTMSTYHQGNYTYQFDVTYTGASAADRYIALLSGYSGQIYNSFHFRNRGSGNNQIHNHGEWITLDASGENYAANTNNHSIVTKLLGKKYDASVQAFTNISVSIRYVVDWENGNSVYMRVNEDGYPGSGKWTLVSKGASKLHFSSIWGGAAIVLKTGGKQNGYIDNIVIWEGTGEEPTDKSNPLIK